MVGRQRRADLVVGDDWEINQKSENPGSQKIPETHGSEKHHRPKMGKWRARVRTLLRAKLQEAPGFEREERQRNHLRCRKESAPSAI